MYTRQWYRLAWIVQSSMTFQTVFERPPETYGFATLGVNEGVWAGQRLLITGRILSEMGDLSFKCSRWRNFLLRRDLGWPNYLAGELGYGILV